MRGATIATATAGTGDTVTPAHCCSLCQTHLVNTPLTSLRPISLVSIPTSISNHCTLIVTLGQL